MMKATLKDDVILVELGADFARDYVKKATEGFYKDFRNMQTVEDVKAWLKALYEDGNLWHMDDDPIDINWENCLFSDQVKILAELQDRAWEICDREKADIFELYPADSWGE